MNLITRNPSSTTRLSFIIFLLFYIPILGFHEYIFLFCFDCRRHIKLLYLRFDFSIPYCWKISMFFTCFGKCIFPKTLVGIPPHPCAPPGIYCPEYSRSYSARMAAINSRCGLFLSPINISEKSPNLQSSQSINAMICIVFISTIKLSQMSP